MATKDFSEHEAAEWGGGDARRCPFHPHVKTSSDDGMFDAPCNECEMEMEDCADCAGCSTCQVVS